jgi:hypothetical protein
MIGSQYETGMAKPNGRMSIEICTYLKKYNYGAKVFSGNVLRYIETVINTTA